MPPQTQTLEPTLAETRWARVDQQVGNTPLLDFSALVPNPKVQLWAKAEWYQLSGSVKARAAWQIVRSALERGALHADKNLMDATSGNTGLAYAAIGAALGLGVTLFVPENCSDARKRLLRAYGADVRYTSPLEGTDGAQAAAEELAAAQPERYYYASQYTNPANWQAHYYQTGPEIWRQTHGRLTHFVAGLGTTGTLVGNARFLQEQEPSVRIVAVQPDSPLHGLEGWKHLPTARTPAIWDATAAHEHRTIGTETAYNLLRRAAREFGVLLSPSAAASLAAARQIAEELEEGFVVTTLADSADKYAEVLESLFSA